MPFGIIHATKLAAIYAAVPKQEVHIEDELEFYNDSMKKAERARNILGTNRRRIAFPDITTSDLCETAAKALLLEQNIDPSSIDALIFVSQSPDYDLPATACVLQHKLGLSKNCAAFDVNQGCSGYVYGLWLASNFIAGGTCSKILLLSGDVSHVERNPKNRIISPIFGDGGSASLIVRDETTAPISFCLGTDGSGYDAIIVPGGRARMFYDRNTTEQKAFFEDIQTESGTPWRLNEIFMDGGAVFNFTLNVVPTHIKEFLEKNNTSPQNIDYLLLHQANKQIVEMVADKAGFPIEKAPSITFSNYGNLSSASVPALFCDLFGAEGNCKKQNLLLCGYGVGLSWASCLIKTDGIACAPVISYEPPHDKPDRNTLIQHWTNVLAGKGEK